MQVQIFGVKKDSGTRKALRFFAERRVKVHFVDLKERPASPGELHRFVQKFGLTALIDRDSRRYAELGLGAARYTLPLDASGIRADLEPGRRHSSPTRSAIQEPTQPGKVPMIKRILFASLALALAGFIVVPTPAEAQFGGLGKKIKQKAEERIEQKEDQAAEAVVDEADKAVTCSVTDQDCIDSAQESGQPVKVTDASGNAVSSQDSAAAMSGGKPASLKPGEGAWANYDFVPGSRVLYSDDFTADRVGNFPKRLEFRSGNMEIVEWQGGRWLRAEDGQFVINLPDTLPERFTMEFDVAGSGNEMHLRFGSDAYIGIGTDFARVVSGDIHGKGELGASSVETPIRIRIAVDGSYLKLYGNEKRALNVPNAQLGRSNQIQVDMNGWSAEDPRLITNIHVAAGGRELYDALAADGRVSTQGIFFDTGSDQIRPESTPTLREIGDMLESHADLKLLIEGHTDNTGAAAANQTLSEQRANAVRQFLIENYGVEGARLQAKGLGQTEPVASNDTPEGRQNNRRVDLVKM
ncbi:MAG: OmpA family protein [Gemmatimonadales bacterium]